jgi:hypothetical protein
MKRKDPQKEADAFNAHIFIGDLIEYQEVIGVTEPQRYYVETAAEVLGGHTAVVWLEGKSGCVCVSHCKRVD